MKKVVKLCLLGLALLCSLTLYGVSDVHAEDTLVETGEWLGMTYTITEDASGIVTCHLSGVQETAITTSTADTDKDSLFQRAPYAPYDERYNPRAKIAERVVVGNCELIDMHDLFYSCVNLKEIIFTEECNTTRVVNMRGLFSGCSNLTSLSINTIDTSNVTLMDHMFNGVSKLSSVNLSNWNTGAVKYMEYMFDECKELTSIDLSSWDTSSLIDSSYVFRYCTKLKDVKLGDPYGGDNIRSYGGMFQYCDSLTEFDFGILSFNANYTGMNRMFEGCHNVNLINLDCIDFNHVDGVDYLFKDCDKLQSISLNNFDFSHIYSMESMFEGCDTLKSVTWEGTTIGITTAMKYAFKDCISLEELDLSKCNMQRIPNLEETWAGCTSLRRVVFPTTETYSGSNLPDTFKGCINLKYVDLSKVRHSYVSARMWPFTDCPALSRVETPPWACREIALNKTMYTKEGVPYTKTPERTASFTLYAEPPGLTKGEVLVSAERSSNLYVSIPKSLILTYDELVQKDKSRYSIKLYGDFSGDDKVDLSISKLANMVQGNKSDIAASNKIYSDNQYTTQITGENETQDKWVSTLSGNTLFSATDEDNAYVLYCEMVTESKLSAGKWVGTSSFGIKLYK